MKTYCLHTLGCKVNQYESQQIRQVLERLGLAPARGSQSPQLIVVNTCCVTHTASAKSRHLIRKARKQHPRARIIVTGCLPVGQDHELNDLFPGPGNTGDAAGILLVSDKNRLPAIFDRLFREKPPVWPPQPGSKPLNAGKIKDKNKAVSQINPHENDAITDDKSLRVSHFLPPLDRYAGHCRAFLKVQDGCDAGCTYCIIPKIRKNVCHKPVKSVLAEATRLISAGHREIVLTGIFLGAYGQSTARRKQWDPAAREDLAELVDAVASLDGLQRLRLSSLEPLDVTDRLLEVMTSHANIMPHLHLSLQSGADPVLRKMARQYRIADYLRVVERVKTAFDRPAITTDIIVGFPGETEADFEQTRAVAEQVGFAKIHVFPFSPRKGTAAIRLADIFGKTDAKELKYRAAALQQLDKQLQQTFRRACAGLTDTVLVESTHPPRGHATRYFTVDLSAHPAAKTLKIGDIANITLD